MVDVPAFTGLKIDGLSVGMPAMQAASLRYFEPTGGFADQVREIIGSGLPAPLAATFAAGATGDRGSILAWRSPTETVLLTTEPAEFARLEQRLSAAADGCMVDQTGGLCVLRLRGRKAGELMLRIGSNASIPGIGEARTSRLAELNVLAVCVEAGQYVVVVERVYAEHLLSWIRATAADF